MTRQNNYYLNAIQKIPLLTQEEEKTLATKAYSGDKTAQNKLVEANLRFVVKIANQYKDFMDVEDLIMEGNLGLMHAARKFNPENGTKFCTYAVFWIRAYIQKAIRDTSTGIRFPATKFNEMKKTKWQIDRLDRVISGDDDEETTLAFFIKDENAKTPEEVFYEKEMKNQLSSLIKMLKENEQSVLTKRYGLDGKEPMSLQEVGTLMGYSKERIRQIEKRALSELRSYITWAEDYTDVMAA